MSCNAEVVTGIALAQPLSRILDRASDKVGIVVVVGIDRAGNECQGPLTHQHPDAA